MSEAGNQSSEKDVPVSWAQQSSATLYGTFTKSNNASLAPLDVRKWGRSCPGIFLPRTL